jgi:Nucleotidyltransferase domain
MDLVNPLALVAPTLDAGVLQALSATTGWHTASRIQRMAGRGSVEGTRRVLARLVAQGIVLADEQPSNTRYLLNRDHLGCGHILGLTRLRGAIIDRIVASINGWDVPPQHASLFGSFARGEASADSDIDLLLIPPLTALASSGDSQVQDLAEEEWRSQGDVLAADIETWTGNRAHVLEVPADLLAEMAAAGDPLVQSWRADQVHLAGDHLLDLLRRLPEKPDRPAGEPR